MIKFIIIITTIFFTGVISVDAQVAESSTNIDLIIEKNSEQVEITKELKILDSSKYIPAGWEDSQQMILPADELKIGQVKINNISGSINKSSLSSDKLTLKYNQSVTTYRSSKYKISYPAKISSVNGGITDIRIPIFAKADFSSGTQKIKTSMRVMISKDFNKPSLVFPTKTIRENSNYWIIEYSQSELTDTATLIQIGEEQIYNFNQEIVFPANKSIIPYEVKVLVPRNIQSGQFEQIVYFNENTSIPNYVELDDYENLVFTYIQIPQEELTINLDMKVKIQKHIDFEFIDSPLNQNPDPKLIAPGMYWDTEREEIIEKANELFVPGSILKSITNNYSFIVDNIDYSKVKRYGINTRQGAYQTLLGGAAVCMEYSDLFIALARTQGIETRAAFGWGFDPIESEEEAVKHQWVESYIPGNKDWMMIDPTWGESGIDVIGADFNRIYHFVSHQSPEEIAPILYYGDYTDGLNIKESAKLSIYETDESESINILTQEQILDQYSKPPAEEIFMYKLNLIFDTRLLLIPLALLSLVTLSSLIRKFRSKVK